MKREPVSPPREMTKADWVAFNIAYTLMQQIALHGAVALETFISAIRESSPSVVVSPQSGNNTK